MIDKRVLLLVALLTFYTLYLQPQSQTVARLADQIALVRGKISREQAIAKAGKDLPIFLAKVHEQAERNRNLLYQGEAGPSQALGHFQEFVKQTAASSGGELVRVNWGEPEKMQNENVSRLPISCRLLLSPSQLDKFLVTLFSAGPLVVVENATARVSEGNIEMDLVLSASMRTSRQQSEGGEIPVPGDAGT